MVWFILRHGKVILNDLPCESELRDEFLSYSYPQDPQRVRGPPKYARTAGLKWWFSFVFHFLALNHCWWLQNILFSHLLVATPKRLLRITRAEDSVWHTGGPHPLMKCVQVKMIDHRGILHGLGGQGRRGTKKTEKVKAAEFLKILTSAIGNYW